MKIISGCFYGFFRLYFIGKKIAVEHAGGRMIISVFNHKIPSTVLAVCLGLSASVPLSAQKLQSKINMVMERLPLEKQKKLADLGGMIETYINTHDYTDSQSDDEIPASIQIFMTDNSVSYESRYSGTFLISNTTDIQYYDKYWKFPYQEGNPLVHIENVYDPFTGLIDFYLYILLGGEFDKYGPLAGSPFYEKAKQINEQAKFNTKFVWGWDERTKLIDFLISENNKPFRLMKDMYFAGMSYAGDQDTTARRFCRGAVFALEKVLKADPEHKEAVQFLNVHHREMLDLLKDDREVLEALLRIDPAREKTYRQYLEK
jgi:hypothetical protein